MTTPLGDPVFQPTRVLAAATFTDVGSYVFNTSGLGTAVFVLTGTPSVFACAFEASHDGVTYFAVQAVPVAGGAPVTALAALSASSGVAYRVSIAGFLRARVRITSLTGTAAIAASGGASAGLTQLLAAVDAPASPISITDSTGTNNLSVDGSGNALVKLAAGTALAGGVKLIDAGGSNAAAVDSSGNVAVKAVAGTAVIGKVGIDQTTPGTTNAVAVTNSGFGQSAVATGGASVSRVISAASTNATVVKGSAGSLYGVIATNTTATIYYLKFYNKATSPTVGTDTPVITIPLLAGQTVQAQFPTGIAFATGIGLALTGAGADNDSTNAATGVYLHAFYA